MRPKAFRVAVLMSTYNGERYLLDQIHSILNQFDANDKLYIRDDGSRDGTIGIIKALSDPRITLTPGQNIGFAPSFLSLLQATEDNFDLYMLADQDDIWLSGKIDRACEVIGDFPEPAMYCSRLRLVNSDLKPIGLSPNFRVPPSFWNALCENIATGCTIALNNSALRTIKSQRLSEITSSKIQYHDWWLYLTLSRFGKVVFDPNPFILYRQHGSNSVGMDSGARRYLKIIKAVHRKSWVAAMINQIRAFLTVYIKDLEPHEVKVLKRFSTGSRTSIAAHLISSRRLIRQSRIGSSLLRILIIYDWFRLKIP